VEIAADGRQDAVTRGDRPTGSAEELIGATHGTGLRMSLDISHLDDWRLTIVPGRSGYPQRLGRDARGNTLVPVPK
jgi:hypothetical protein